MHQILRCEFEARPHGYMLQVILSEASKYVTKTNLCQLSVIVSIHGGLSLWKKFGGRGAFHRRLQQHVHVTTKAPAVAMILSELLRMNVSDAHAEKIVSLVDEMVRYCDDKDTLSIQWKISRSIQLILNEANAIHADMTLVSDMDFRQKVDIREDIIPRLASALDDMLHNYLLTRMQ